MATRVKKSINEKFVLFATAEECADAAAPVFVANRWCWTRCGIPNREQILSTLLMLENDTKTHPELAPHMETGRLVYWHGRYGHERPKTQEEV